MKPENLDTLDHELNALMNRLGLHMMDETESAVYYLQQSQGLPSDNEGEPASPARDENLTVHSRPAIIVQNQSVEQSLNETPTDVTGQATMQDQVQVVDMELFRQFQQYKADMKREQELRQAALATMPPTTVAAPAAQAAPAAATNTAAAGAAAATAAPEIPNPAQPSPATPTNTGSGDSNRQARLVTHDIHTNVASAPNRSLQYNYNLSPDPTDTLAHVDDYDNEDDSTATTANEQDGTATTDDQRGAGTTTGDTTGAATHGLLPPLPPAQPAHRLYNHAEYYNHHHQTVAEAEIWLVLAYDTDQNTPSYIHRALSITTMEECAREQSRYTYATIDEQPFTHESLFNVRKFMEYVQRFPGMVDAHRQQDGFSPPLYFQQRAYSAYTGVCTGRDNLHGLDGRSYAILLAVHRRMDESCHQKPAGCYACSVMSATGRSRWSAAVEEVLRHTRINRSIKRTTTRWMEKAQQQAPLNCRNQFALNNERITQILLDYMKLKGIPSLAEMENHLPLTRRMAQEMVQELKNPHQPGNQSTTSAPGNQSTTSAPGNQPTSAPNTATAVNTEATTSQASQR